MSSRDNILIHTDTRLFYLGDDVSNETIGKLCFNILYLLQQDDEKEAKEVGFTRTPIKLYIQSFGGESRDMWALVDIIIHSKTPIHTYCNGYAMSAGFLIYLAGHKRFAYPHSTFLYHQISCWRHGKYQDLVEDRDETDYLQRSLEEFVISRTKITQEQLDDNKSKKIDWYIHTPQAVELGIVTDVVGQYGCS